MIKQVAEFPRYSINEKGQVFGIFGKPLIPNRNKSGCRQLGLYKRDDNGKNNKYTKSIHRLVAFTFLGGDIHNSNQHVIHKNGDVSDNRLENLEIVSIIY